MLSVWLPFIGFAVVTLFTPGPNNMMLTASGLNFGFRRSVPHIVGVSLGFSFMVLLVGWGLAGLFTTSVLLHQVLKVIGVLYLLYLAYKIATAPAQVDEGESRAKPMTFWQAVAFQWVNPKGWVMAVGATTSYTTMNGDNFKEVLIIGLIFLFFGFQSSATWNLFGLFIRRWLKDPKHIRAFNIVMGLALVASIAPLIAE
jgi:threonine/homoserine/homoserine lactone efflux protein